MFRALLANPQEGLLKRHFVYCLRMPVGCGTVAGSLEPCHSRVALPEDGQVMLETFRGPLSSIN
jgi:hypothetical protein